MISFLTSPKPFLGHAESNQIIAIRSWLAIDSEVEVILYGDSEDIAGPAKKLGIQSVSGIQTNEYGTPLFGAIVAHAADHARHDLHVYVNSDVILTREFLRATKMIPFSSFLMIGQRIDLGEGVILDVMNGNWKSDLVSMAQKGDVSLHAPTGSDYFAFPRGLWNVVPPIAIGRGGFDNALIALCLERRVPVVDATVCVPAIHQFHDYSHLPGGRNYVFEGEEAVLNLKYCKGQIGVSVSNSTWRLDSSGLRRNWARGDWLRALETALRFAYGLTLAAWFVRRLQSLAYRMAMSRPKSVTLKQIFSCICDESS
ncbi:hypothetical protein ACFLS1_03545 [Verrucomicrobiota bacterium]